MTSAFCFYYILLLSDGCMRTAQEDSEPKKNSSSTPRQVGGALLSDQVKR
jgi:hypothetical protein